MVLQSFLLLFFWQFFFVSVGFFESFFKIDWREINIKKKVLKVILSFFTIFFLTSPFIYLSNLKKDFVLDIIYQEYLFNNSSILENKMVAGIIDTGISDFNGWDVYNNSAYFLKYNFRNMATKEQIKDNKNTDWFGMVDYYISFVPINNPEEFNLFLDSTIYFNKNIPSIYVYK